ncbi:flagellar motor switch protein FliM [Paenibacillus sp. TRM 82003]|uniref:flagellar motor switch protein FliM n=1 Tax=Kineococcus sp. TRM81007 TaxID=2925831 RepID=UPI001F5ABCB3|nr:flagellar motor switch protein FliM [Kineococcus sp. TRM81007]MCI2240600.1 flagellar motor switch protein FliM [Kineococcus sp. TRM81007]MCI3925478.1 flagellar motor switch protein FliM [Paenibacillus sp. TRM 82003]
MAPETSTSAERTGGRRSRRRGVPVPYDFRRPTKLSRQHARVLEITYETFCRQWATLLSSTLRTSVQVELDGVQQFSYDEYAATLATPSIMTVFDPEPLVGAGVLHLDTPLMLTFVERMLGGTGAHEQPLRVLTDIEAVLCRGMVERTLGELAASLTSIVDLKPHLTSIEQNPQFAQASAATDVMIVASFHLQVERIEGTATLALPLDPLSAALSAAELRVASPEELRIRRLMRDRLDDHLEHIPVEVSVRLNATQLRPDQILALVPGDVLRLPHAAEAPLEVVASDTLVASAVAGSRGSRLACLIVPTPEESSR